MRLVFGSRITSTFPISLCYARTVRWTACGVVLEVQMPEPRGVSEHIVVPSMGSREIARAQRSVSGAAKMRSRHSISAIVYSASTRQYS
jgi:hypothetical protein